jgi:hypothetical protein
MVNLIWFFVVYVKCFFLKNNREQQVEWVSSLVLTAKVLIVHLCEFLLYLQFSHVMNKLFITCNSVIYLGFKCNHFGPGLFVRALLVFCDAEAFQEPVVRCLHHKQIDHPVNAGNCNILRWSNSFSLAFWTWRFIAINTKVYLNPGNPVHAPHIIYL